MHEDHPLIRWWGSDLCDPIGVDIEVKGLASWVNRVERSRAKGLRGGAENYGCSQINPQTGDHPYD